MSKYNLNFIDLTEECSVKLPLQAVEPKSRQISDEQLVGCISVQEEYGKSTPTNRSLCSGQKSKGRKGKLRGIGNVAKRKSSRKEDIESTDFKTGLSKKALKSEQETSFRPIGIDHSVDLVDLLEDENERPFLSNIPLFFLPDPFTFSAEEIRADGQRKSDDRNITELSKPPRNHNTLGTGKNSSGSISREVIDISSDGELENIRVSATSRTNSWKDCASDSLEATRTAKNEKTKHVVGPNTSDFEENKLNLKQRTSDKEGIFRNSSIDPGSSMKPFQGIEFFVSDSREDPKGKSRQVKTSAPSKFMPKKRKSLGMKSKTENNQGKKSFVIMIDDSEDETLCSVSNQNVDAPHLERKSLPLKDTPKADTGEPFTPELESMAAFDDLQRAAKCSEDKCIHSKSEVIPLSVEVSRNTRREISKKISQKRREFDFDNVSQEKISPISSTEKNRSNQMENSGITSDVEENRLKLDHTVSSPNLSLLNLDNEKAFDMYEKKEQNTLKIKKARKKKKSTRSNQREKPRINAVAQFQQGCDALMTPNTTKDCSPFDNIAFLESNVVSAIFSNEKDSNYSIQKLKSSLKNLKPLSEPCVQGDENINEKDLAADFPEQSSSIILNNNSRTFVAEHKPSTGMLVISIDDSDDETIGFENVTKKDHRGTTHLRSRLWSRHLPHCRADKVRTEIRQEYIPRAELSLSSSKCFPESTSRENSSLELSPHSEAFNEERGGQYEMDRDVTLQIQGSACNQASTKSSIKLSSDASNTKEMTEVACESLDFAINDKCLVAVPCCANSLSQDDMLERIENQVQNNGGIVRKKKKPRKRSKEAILMKKRRKRARNQLQEHSDALPPSAATQPGDSSFMGSARAINDKMTLCFDALNSETSKAQRPEASESNKSNASQFSSVKSVSSIDPIGFTHTTAVEKCITCAENTDTCSDKVFHCHNIEDEPTEVAQEEGIRLEFRSMSFEESYHSNQENCLKGDVVSTEKSLGNNHEHTQTILSFVKLHRNESNTSQSGMLGVQGDVDPLEKGNMESRATHLPSDAISSEEIHILNRNIDNSEKVKEKIFSFSTHGKCESIAEEIESARMFSRTSKSKTIKYISSAGLTGIPGEVFQDNAVSRCIKQSLNSCLEIVEERLSKINTRALEDEPLVNSKDPNNAHLLVSTDTLSKTYVDITENELTRLQNCERKEECMLANSSRKKRQELTKGEILDSQQSRIELAHADTFSDLFQMQMLSEQSENLNVPNILKSKSRDFKREDKDEGGIVGSNGYDPEKRNLLKQQNANIFVKLHRGEPNFILIDSSSDEEFEIWHQLSMPQKQKKFRKKRKRAAFCPTADFSFAKSIQEATEEQEKLFQQAAEAFRLQTEYHQQLKHQMYESKNPTFTQPVDPSKLHENHWKWQCVYARLGLPVNASKAVLKKHYRVHALRYHPDKCRLKDASLRFQAVTEAYNKILQQRH
jgi:DnaJ domain